MLKTVYPRVKEANPEMQIIIIGGLLLDCDPENVPRHKIDCLSSKFFEGILKNGGSLYFDGVGFHSFDYAYGGYYYENPNWHNASDKTGPVLVAKAAYLKNSMEQFGITNKFIIITETALLCVGECNTEYHDLALAYYLTHSYAYAVTKDLRASLWYSIFGWLGSGLLDQDLSQLPAYESFKVANQKIGSVSSSGRSMSTKESEDWNLLMREGKYGYYGRVMVKIPQSCCQLSQYQFVMRWEILNL